MSGKKDRTVIVWLDLETSALEPDDGVILEIAAIATDEDLREVGRRFHAVLEAPASMEEQVERMHRASGLYEQCQRSDVTEPRAEVQFYWWLSAQGMAHIIMAGSGVSHFDMRWLKARMPSAAGLFSYAPIDVGVLRRSLRLVNVAVPDVPESSGKAKAHRAMLDVEAHLREFLAIKAALETERSTPPQHNNQEGKSS